MKVKTKNMFDITIEDVKFSVFNINEDRLDYLVNRAGYPYGWEVRDTTNVKEDNNYFLFTVENGRFALNKMPEDTIPHSERGVFVTADVVDFHAPSDNLYKDTIKVSKLYKDPKVVGNLCYLKKKEIISQTRISENESLVKARSYNGPIIIQGKRFFMCNGSTWIITYRVKDTGETTLLSKSPESLHIYGWGYVIGVQKSEA